MKRNYSIWLVFIIVLLFVVVVSASFAYFAGGSVNTSNSTYVNTTTGETSNVSIITIGDSLNLSVSTESMLASKVKYLPVSSDDASLEVRLVAGTSEEPMECEYDIYYVYETNTSSTAYTRSDVNQKEFTYSIKKNTVLYVNESNYVNTTNTPQKVLTSKIKSYGQEVKDTYEITSRFYNINANQSANAGGNWTIKFYVDTNESRCSIGNNSYNGIIYTNGKQIFLSTNKDINTISGYTTSLEDQLNKQDEIYCVTGENCTLFDEHYLDHDECVNYNDDYCDPAMTSRPYYLKHLVKDGKIEVTEACLYVNNIELCFDSNYFDVNVEATKEKLQSDMEKVADNTLRCGTDSSMHDAWCRYQNYYIDIYEGDSTVRFLSDGWCSVNESGTSNCEWEGSGD